ncbi:hypothetical protein GQ600_26997 [Phytophthora cactorum]|nr:hypothetical protein GQ600_26997 [Phytophthora cactorum]
MSLRVTRSVIEDIKEDAKLILSNRKAAKANRTLHISEKTRLLANRNPKRSQRDVKARIAATTNQPVQSSTDAVFSVTDIVATTDAAVPSADAAVVTTEVVTLTDVVTLSAEAVPFFDADAAAIHDLLNKLRGSTVSASVQVIIDKDDNWTRSCKVGLECVMALMASGIPVYHSRNMMHDKLLTISYDDSMVAVGGSANMTKLHGRGMTSLYSMSKDQPIPSKHRAVIYVFTDTVAPEVSIGL